MENVENQECDVEKVFHIENVENWICDVENLG